MDLSSIIRCFRFFDETSRLEPNHEFSRGVRCYDQLFRKTTNRHWLWPTMPLYGKKSLVLLRGEADVARGLQAEIHEYAQRVTKLSETLKISLGKPVLVRQDDPS